MAGISGESESLVISCAAEAAITGIWRCSEREAKRVPGANRRQTFVS